MFAGRLGDLLDLADLDRLTTTLPTVLRSGIIAGKFLKVKRTLNAESLSASGGRGKLDTNVVSAMPLTVRGHYPTKK